MNLDDFQLALKFHTAANRSISQSEFQRAVRISSGFELDPLIVEVIFQVFDENKDGQLSYKEFIAVLKDRLNRGLKVELIYSFFIYQKGNIIIFFNLSQRVDKSTSLMIFQKAIYFRMQMRTVKVMLLK